MAAAWIVEALDEFEDRTTCFGLGLEPTPIEQLALEGREETLAHRVVVRVADRAHRWAHACITTAATELDRGILAGLQWSSQHVEGGVAMTRRRRRSDRSGRAPLFSPGRPVVAGRDERRRFWAAIAAGMASEDAAVQVGMSQAVGTRLFREAGGMPPAMFGHQRSRCPAGISHLRSGKRSHFFACKAAPCGRFGADSDEQLQRFRGSCANAATRSGSLEYRATTAQWHAERSARRPKQAKLALNATLRTYVEERLAGVVVAPGGAPVPGPAVRWTGPAWTAEASAVGKRLEPGADCLPLAGRLPGR